jgi:hypothetical protein
MALGLATATFLFGVLRSYAAYTGKVGAGSIELGGPIVSIVLGFYLTPRSQPITLTISVHEGAGRQDVDLRDAGSVLIDLGGDRRREMIGDKGQAICVGIPPTFLGQPISVSVDAEGYETIRPDSAVKLESDSTYVAVRPKADELTGYVRSEGG